MRLRVSMFLFVVACGARSSLLEPDGSSGAGGSGGGGGGERSCLPECFVGHECCVASCDGPAVVMPSDCCACLEGEVGSESCPNGQCGKPPPSCNAEGSG